jgi:hypothetical protein
MSPIGLSDEQHTRLLHFASQIAPGLRDQFLQRVAAGLRGRAHDGVGDGDLDRALRAARAAVARVPADWPTLPAA